MWKRMVLLSAGAAASIAIAAPAEFEVASVRPNTLNDQIVKLDIGPGGRFAARGYTLVLLIQQAFGVMDWNVEGGPGWIRSDRFDVVATAQVSRSLTEAELRPMLRDLLVKRFRLRTHTSSRRMRGYALVVANGGLKVKSVADRQEHRDTARMDNRGMNWEGLSMADFARFVGGKLNLFPAIDETGLKGLYNFKADWKVDANPYGDDDARSTVLAALRNQLGLKFVGKTVTVQTIVIDGAEQARASDN
jgi:uncharacterized protein (TIGR03435 family)